MIQKIGVVFFALAVSLSSVNAIAQAEFQTFLTHHTRDAVMNGTAPLLAPCRRRRPCASTLFWRFAISRSCWIS